MKIRFWIPAAIVVTGLSAGAQSAEDGHFRLALPDQAGQISWQADGFQVVQSSAKPGGNEIGLRGKDASGRLAFLGFLFRLNGAQSSAKCRDGVVEANKHNLPAFKVAHMSEIPRSGGIPVVLIEYSLPDKSGKPLYSVRGFVASGELCGDLEFYSSDPIKAEDAGLHKAFESFQFDPHYKPAFKDVFMYAQVLFDTHQYGAAGPYFEKALSRLDNSSGFETKTWTRVATDQAGMAYGISGNLKKSRALFENAIARDPDYPLFYYNLACADAEEKNLTDARRHLQQAFDRKANTLPGEKMPDPTQDDSFTPYKDNKEFWKFLEGLRAKT